MWSVALWPVFSRAGQSGWLLIGFIIPIVNIVVSIVVALGAGRAFGKDGFFSFFLLWLLSPIGFLIIGYGHARFLGPGGRPDE